MNYQVGLPVEINIEALPGFCKAGTVIGTIQEYKPKSFIRVNGEIFWIGAYGDSDRRHWRAKPYEGELPIPKAKKVSKGAKP